MPLKNRTILNGSTKDGTKIVTNLKQNPSLNLCLLWKYRQLEAVSSARSWCSPFIRATTEQSKHYSFYITCGVDKKKNVTWSTSCVDSPTHFLCFCFEKHRFYSIFLCQTLFNSIITTLWAQLWRSVSSRPTMHAVLIHFALTQETGGKTFELHKYVSVKLPEGKKRSVIYNHYYYYI